MRHCEICDKDISATNWSKHVKTRVHQSHITARAPPVAQTPEPQGYITQLRALLDPLEDAVLTQTFPSGNRAGTISVRIDREMRTLQDYDLRLFVEILNIVLRHEYPRITLSTSVSFTRLENDGENTVHGITTHTQQLLVNDNLAQRLNGLRDEIQTCLLYTSPSPRD